MHVRMGSTGRARGLRFFLNGPGSMHKHRFQNLIKLLIALQLLLPSGAPWLHTLIDGSCCAVGAHSHRGPSPQDAHPSWCAHTGCSHSHASHSADNPCGNPAEPAGDTTPHDCSDCPVCQAMAAPRMLALVVVLPLAVELIETLPLPDCADPLLGFGLPPQCRAPPAA
jgi:hypothetical protein